MDLKQSTKLKVGVFEHSNVMRTLWSKFLSDTEYQLFFFEGDSYDPEELSEYAPDFLVFPGVPEEYSPADIISDLNADCPDLNPTVIVTTSLEKKDMEAEWDIEIVNGVLFKPFSREDIFEVFEPFVAEKKRGNSEKPRVVLIDDSKTVVSVLKKQIEGFGFHVDTATDGREGIDLVLETMPHVVIVDLQMPGMSGYEVCTELAANPRTRRIPVIIESATISEDTTKKGFWAGAVDMLPKPVESALLAKALHDVIPLTAGNSRGSLVVLEDSTIIASIITKIASEVGLSTISYSTIKEFKAHLTVSKPDIISVDLSLPDGSGLDLIREIRSDSRFDSVSILMLTGQDDSATMLNCLQSGANDFITKPFTKQELLARLGSQLRVKELFNEIMRKNRILEELAFLDALTGLMNRRFFDKKIKQLIDEAKETEQPFSLLMIDLDLFKKVNDTHGHEAGDLVLARIADLVKQNVRREDVACRYGGEEMVVLLPDCKANRAYDIAQRVRRACESTKLCQFGMIQTVSIGVATYSPDDGHEELIIAAADDALYQAKKAGRNQVVMAT